MSTPPFCNQFIEIAICGFRSSTDMPRLPRTWVTLPCAVAGPKAGRTPSLRSGALTNRISCSSSTSASGPGLRSSGFWATTVPLCESIESVDCVPCSAHSKSLAGRLARGSAPVCPQANDGRHPVAPMNNRSPGAAWKHYSSPIDWVQRGTCLAKQVLLACPSSEGSC